MNESVLATIIIPNWNGRNLLASCLHSLESQTCTEHEIIVVDNGSTDDSVEWLKTNYPSVRLIANSTNRGFAAAVNQGIQASASRYVATLNNDAVADSGWLAALVEAAESDARVGMCASKMLFAGRPYLINSTGICVDRVGIAWDRRGGDMDDERETRPIEIFGPCAGAALYRRSMLDEIGLFDEDFFAYLEDVDLAWRARQAGWSCLYVPAAQVYHHHSATGVEGSPFKSFHRGRNKVWLVVKNYPFRQLWPYAPLVILYDLMAAAYALIAWRDIHALRGRLASLPALGKMWSKRCCFDRARRMDIEWLAPLQAPWNIPGRYRHLGP